MITNEKLIELANKLEGMSKAKRAEADSLKGLECINAGGEAVGLQTSVVEIWKLINNIN